MAIPVSRRLDFTEIPVIDVSELVAGNDDEATIDALGAACRDVGFVYIKNHGVPQHLLDDVLAASREFFARPMDEKKRVLVNDRMRGYLPLRYRSYEGEDNAAQSNQEGYWMGPDRSLDPANRLDGPNVWPERGEALQIALEAYHEAVNALSDVLARAFSLALGQDTDFLSNLLNPVTQLLKVNHYPPQDNPTSVSDIGVVPHSDEGSFTILWQDENGGLEIESKSGEWVEAPPIPGTYVVNLGDMLQIWSNGEFSSTPHRVINRSGTDRYSIPLFSYARSDAPITPLLNGAVDDPDADDCEQYQLKAWRRIFPIANIPEPVEETTMSGNNETGNDKTHVAMTNGGAYSLATLGAKDVIDGAWPLVRDAIERIPDRQGSAFTFSDMGTADGGTSLDMIGDAIAVVRERFPERDVQIVYTDQPRNDYNAIFQMVHGLGGQASYLDRFDNVQVLASATSFYEPILPKGTLDLGFSATAMHWLSRKPCDIPDHVHPVGATGESLEAFQRQATEDWEAILLRRAAELAPGGRLVLVNFGVDDEGRYLGNTGGVNMFDTFHAIWSGFVADGTITEAEYAAMTLPQYYKSVDEFRAPLDDPESEVSKAGLSVEHCETRVVPCPFAADFRDHGDAARFAAAYVPTLRSWSAATFRNGLSNDRSDTERDQIIDDFYGAYETMVHEAPDGHAMDYVHVYLTIAKA